MSEDGSNGYEGIASIYVAGRGTRPLVGDAIGAATVRAWAQAFPTGATVLDLGSGPGEPSTRILQEAGLATYAVDASSAMVAAFRERFPGVPIEQNTVEASEFFDRTFDGVLSQRLRTRVAVAQLYEATGSCGVAIIGGGVASGGPTRHDLSDPSEIVRGALAQEGVPFLPVLFRETVGRSAIGWRVILRRAGIG